MGGSIDFGLVRDKEDARAVQKFLNPLPRSILRRNVFELLDGEWRFDFDLEDRGLNEKWFLSHDYSRSAVWPGSVESYMAEAMHAQEHTPEWQDQIVVWYERDFEIPGTWCRDPGCIVQVT